MDESGTSKPELAALHHDGVSRLLIASGHSHLGSQQASRFSHTLNIPSNSTNKLPRKALFDDSIEEFIRVPSIEKGQQNKRLQAISSSHSRDDSLKDNHLHPTLSHALPEWYEIQNPHCLKCSIPLFIGINASFNPSRGGLICVICGNIQSTGKPDVTSKRKLRSLHVRQNPNHKRAKQVNPNVTSKKGQSELLPNFPSAVKTKKVDQTSQDKLVIMKDQEQSGKPSPSKDIIPNTEKVISSMSTTMPISLDARMKQKKREKKSGNSNEMAEKKSEIHTTLLQGTETQAPIRSENSQQLESTRVGKIKSQSDSRPTQTSTSKARQHNEKDKSKQALRDILSAKKKKSESEKNKKSNDNDGISNNSGLQGFLDSL